MSLFATNLDAFRRRYPEVAAVLAGPAPVVVTDGGRVNVRVGGDFLYPEDARIDSIAQVERWMAAPRRLNVPIDRPYFYEHLFDDAEREAFADLEAAAAAAAGAAAEPMDGACLLVCFGIGLGFHVEALLERLDVAVLYLADADAGMLAASCRVFDWAGLFAACEARGIVVRFHLGDDGFGFFAKVHGDLRPRRAAGIAEAAFFTHYGHPAFARAERAFLDNLSALLGGWGYFADEERLLANALANVKSGRPLRVFEPPFAAFPVVPATGETALVVASGPSLAGALDVLGALKETAWLISCGTSIAVLAAHGIVPDLHVEVESEPRPFDNVAAVFARHGLERVPLVLPLTADPRFATGFADRPRAYYSRGDLTPHGLVEDQVRPLMPGGPMVDLIGVAVALALGVARVVLFGVDMGARDPAAHHVAGTHYDHSQEDNKRDPAFRQRFTYDLTGPGNLGGTVHTSQTFLWQKVTHETIIRQNPAIEWWNASDGLAIAGARPAVDPRAAAAGGTAPDRAGPGPLERLRPRVLDPGPVGARARHLRQAAGAGLLSRALAAAPRDRGIPGLVAAVAAALAAAERDPALVRMMAGQLQWYLHVYLGLRRAVPTRAARRDLDARFRTRLVDLVTRLESRVAEHGNRC